VWRFEAKLFPSSGDALRSFRDRVFAFPELASLRISRARQTLTGVGVAVDLKLDEEG
jgi:hypothetical protein